MKKLNTILLCIGLVIFLSRNATGQPFLPLKGGTLTGALNGTTAVFSGNVTAGSFIKSGGTSSEILAANGSVITAGTGITISGGTIHFTASTSGWSLTGNSGTVDGTNFIGTTDNVPLTFKVNNTLSGRIESDGTKANTFFGYNSGVANTGTNNTGNGYQALFSNTAGNFNTGNGYQALYSNTSGNWSTATGYQALFSNTSVGSQNTAIGFQALYSNTSGVGNTAIGMTALNINHTGSGITALGAGANVNADGYINSTAVGANALIDASNEIILGNPVITTIKAAVTSITSLSDRRFKKNIKEDVPGLEFINLLKPVTYNYDMKSFNSHRAADMTAMKSSKVLQASKLSKEDEAAITKKEKIVYSGLVAQDVEVAANKIGYDFSGLYKPQNDKDAYGLGYADFVVPLIKATQELSASNDSLKSQVTELQNQLNEIKAQLASMNKGGVSASSAIISSARLEQNIPNPFNQTTQINYSVPQTAGSAMIVVTGMNGEKIRTVSLNAKGNGQLTLQTAQLVAGTYNYSLYVDGNLIDTKKMILAK